MPYRGIKPFRYADRNIFSARDWEKEQLLNLVSLYRGCLLYGESGIGKSSLINAGLIPALEDHNFRGEIVRVSPNRNGAFIIYRVPQSDAGNKNYLPSLFSHPSNQRPELNLSFEDFKKIIYRQKYVERNVESENESHDQTLMPIPVLIFDQFEELITLFEETSKKSIAENDISYPERIKFQVELIDFFKDCYYNPSLRIKFLFVFREDYLAKFSKLFRAIPDLRDHTLRIKSISKEDINEIIKCPFSADAHMQVYPNALSEELISLLGANLGTYFGDSNAVLTDIQIACQYVYETEVKHRHLLFSNETEHVRHPIQNIIQSFYEKLLGSLPTKEKPVAIDILQMLVLNEQTRNIFHGEAIIEELKSAYGNKVIDSVLKKLDTDTRLIRSEIRAGGIYYEINSESLIPYINSLKKEKEQAEREKKLEMALQYEKSEKEKERHRADENNLLKKKADDRYKMAKTSMRIAILLFLIACIALVMFYHKNEQAKIALSIANLERADLLIAEAVTNSSIQDPENVSMAQQQLEEARGIIESCQDLRETETERKKSLLMKIAELQK